MKRFLLFTIIVITSLGSFAQKPVSCPDWSQGRSGKFLHKLSNIKVEIPVHKKSKSFGATVIYNEDYVPGIEQTMINIADQVTEDFSDIEFFNNQPAEEISMQKISRSEEQQIVEPDIEEEQTTVSPSEKITSPSSSDNSAYGLALAGFILSLVGWFLLPFICLPVAIVLSAIAMGKIGKGEKGRGMAVAGLIIGVAGLVIMVGLVMLLLGMGI